MSTKSIKLIFCLILFWQISYGQDTRVIIEPKIARLVLKDLAELDMRRLDAKSDSATITDLYQANFELENQARDLTKALKECDGGSEEKDKLIVRQGKEIKKQKGLKVLAIVGMGLVALASALF